MREFLSLWWPGLAALAIVVWLCSIIASDWFKTDVSSEPPAPTQPDILVLLRRTDSDDFAEWFMDLAQSGSNLTRNEAFALWERFQVNVEVSEHQEMMLEKGKEAA